MERALIGEGIELLSDARCALVRSDSFVQHDTHLLALAEHHLALGREPNLPLPGGIDDLAAGLLDAVH